MIFSLLVLHIIHVPCHVHHLAYCMYSHFCPIPSLLLRIYQIHKLLHDCGARHVLCALRMPSLHILVLVSFIFELSHKLSFYRASTALFRALRLLLPLTDKQGSPPLQHYCWSRLLHTPHTEAQLWIGMGVWEVVKSYLTSA